MMWDCQKDVCMCDCKDGCCPNTCELLRKIFRKKERTTSEIGGGGGGEDLESLLVEHSLGYEEKENSVAPLPRVNSIQNDKHVLAAGGSFYSNLDTVMDADQWKER